MLAIRRNSFVCFWLHRTPDDEPYTDEQQRAGAEALAAMDRGEGISHEDMLREFGPNE